MNKINWKERLHNKVFLYSMAGLILSFVYKVFAIIGFVPETSESSIMETIEMLLYVLVGFGVITDPTTDGLGDSERALTYGTKEDVRYIKGNETKGF